MARLGDAQLPPYEKLYALVRSSAQADAVKQYGAEPMTFDAWNETAVSEAIVENEINIVFFLVDAMRPTSQVLFIDALAKVKQKTGKEVHFLHVSSHSSHDKRPRLTVPRPLVQSCSRVTLGHRQMGLSWTLIKISIVHKRAKSHLWHWSKESVYSVLLWPKD